MEQQWPEGPNADPDAAGDRYNADLQASRARTRKLCRAELPVAHSGLAITIVASVVVGVACSPGAGMIIAGSFAALFVVALVVVLVAGGGGWGAVRAAYRFTFGWAEWM